MAIQIVDRATWSIMQGKWDGVKDSRGDLVEVTNVVRNAQNNLLIVTLDHLTLFVVQGKAKYRAYLPISARFQTGGW